MFGKEDVTSELTDTEIFEQLLHQANEWVGSLDRSVIGAFAADPKMLAIAHVRELIKWEHVKIPKVYKDRVLKHVSLMRATLIGGEISSNIIIENSTSLDERVRSELRLWWDMKGFKRIYHTGKESQDSYSMIFTTSFLEYLIEKPVYLPYYEAGLRQEFMIKRCIEFNIDPNIASQMYLDE